MHEEFSSGSLEEDTKLGDVDREDTTNYKEEGSELQTGFVSGNGRFYIM
jgi:hypothetical protein